MSSYAGPRVTFVDLDPEIAWVFRDAAQEADVDVDVACGSIHDIDVDAVVAPTNSFGFMDGGLDLTHVLHFGDHVQQRVVAAIGTDFHGELLVGQATVVRTEDPRQPFLIAAPTMRVPMRLPPDTVNPYLAMRAVLLAAARHPEPIRSVAVPGLGTGVGRMPPAVAAHQMARAVRRFRHGATGPPQTWDLAVQEHVILTNRQGPSVPSTFPT